MKENQEGNRLLGKLIFAFRLALKERLGGLRNDRLFLSECWDVKLTVPGVWSQTIYLKSSCRPLLEQAAALHLAAKNRCLMYEPNGHAHTEKKKGGPGDGTSGRVASALYPYDAPRDFGPEVAFSLSFASLSDTWPHWRGREMSAPRPYVTDPFPTCLAQLGPLDKT